MDDEKLLKALAEAAHRRDGNDKLAALWDEYSSGQLSAEKLEELRHELADDHDPNSVEAAFAPLEDSFRDDVVSQLKDKLAGSSTAVEPATVTQLRKPRFINFPTALAATLLAALGLSLMLRTGDDMMNLPHYEYTLQGGTEFRSSDVSVENRVFKPGERLQLTLTPQSSTDQDLVGRAFLNSDGELREISKLSIEVAESGAARLSGRIGEEIPVYLGDNEMLVVIGVADMIPAAPQLQQRVAEKNPASGDGWQAWRIDYSVSDR